WLHSNLVPLLKEDPDLTGVISFDRDRWTTPRHWQKLWQIVRRLRAQSFDWVIDLQGLARSGSIAWLANGNLTIGLDEPREGARGFYDIIVARPSFHTHAVDWYLGVLPLLGLPGAERRGPALGERTDIAQSWSSALRGEDFAWLPERPEIASSIRQKW